MLTVSVAPELYATQVSARYLFQNQRYNQKRISIFPNFDKIIYNSTTLYCLCFIFCMCTHKTMVHRHTKIHISPMQVVEVMNSFYQRHWKFAFKFSKITFLQILQILYFSCKGHGVCYLFLDYQLSTRV